MVGYGAGALAIIDVARHTVLARLELPAHPEGFQIDTQTGRAFVNLPNRRAIGVVDLDHGTTVSAWRLPPLLWNYPLALDPSGDGLASVFRQPSQLVLFDRANGAVLSSQPTCGDADDVYFDARRDRIYVTCGAGQIDAFDVSGASAARRDDINLCRRANVFVRCAK